MEPIGIKEDLPKDISFFGRILYNKPGSLTVEYKKKCLKALKKGFFFVKYFVFMYVILCHCVL